MRLRHFVSALAFVAGLLVTTTAFAAVPSPSTSAVPQCLTVCPAGDVPFTVTVRDIAGNTVIGSNVVIQLQSCPNVILCPANGTEPYTYEPAGRLLRMITPASGVVTFPIRAGGVCTGAVNVYADGVLLRQLEGVASPDQDGDLVVGLLDADLINEKMETGDVSADFDCDGTVTRPDFQYAADHGSHHCLPNPTPTLPSTWGRLKQIYR